MHAFIKLFYSLLIAGCLIAFVAVGISTFKQAPKYPDYPQNCYNVEANSDLTLPCEAKYNQQQSEFDKKDKAYHRTTTLFALPAAIVTILIGTFLIKRSEVIGEGIALGGVGTAIYAIITSVEAEARGLTFASLTVLLAGAILLGWRRFASKPDPI